MLFMASRRSGESWEQKLHGNAQPQEEQGLLWAGTGTGVLCTGARLCPACLATCVPRCCGAVQGAQPAPLAPEEQILAICPLDAARLGLSLCPHLMSDARCV